MNIYGSIMRKSKIVLRTTKLLILLLLILLKILLRKVIIGYVTIIVLINFLAITIIKNEQLRFFHPHHTKLRCNGLLMFLTPKNGKNK